MRPSHLISPLFLCFSLSAWALSGKAPQSPLPSSGASPLVGVTLVQPESGLTWSPRGVNDILNDLDSLGSLPVGTNPSELQPVASPPAVETKPATTASAPMAP